MRRLATASFVLVGAVVALVACQGGNSNPPPLPTGQSNQFSVTTTQTVPLNAGSQTVNLPSSNDFGGTATLPSTQSSSSSATFTLTIQNFPPTDGTPAVSMVRAAQAGSRSTEALPAHTTLLYIGVKADKDVTLPKGLQFSVKVPPGLLDPTKQYYIVFYDATSQSWVVYAGPATISGNTVTFTAGIAVSLKANVQYWFALISVAAGSITPSPVPTATPTGGGTPTVAPSATPTGGGTPTVAPTASPTGGGTPTAVPTATPTGGGTPTAVPTATPTPQALSVSPAPTLNVNGIGSGNASRATVHEGGYTGAFTESDTCSGIASLAVATGSTGNGPDSSYTVTGLAAGQCDVTFKDAFNQSVSTHVVVTVGTFHISGARRQ